MPYLFICVMIDNNDFFFMKERVQAIQKYVHSGIGNHKIKTSKLCSENEQRFRGLHKLWDDSLDSSNNIFSQIYAILLSQLDQFRV